MIKLVLVFRKYVEQQPSSTNEEAIIIGFDALKEVFACNKQTKK